MKNIDASVKILLGVVLAVFYLVFNGYRLWSPVADRPGLYLKPTEAGSFDYRKHRLPLTGDVYGETVVYRTAENFKKDGFLKTYFLPNRHGVPLMNFWPTSWSRCAKTVTPSPDDIYVINFFGQLKPLTSLSQDCVYTHYPPLIDIIYGIAAKTGFHSFRGLRLITFAITTIGILGLFLLLRQVVSFYPAVFAIVFVVTSKEFMDWGLNLNYTSIQYPILYFTFYCWIRYLRERNQHFAVAAFGLHALQGYASFELILFSGIGILGLQFYFLLRRSFKASQFYRTCILVAVVTLVPFIIGYIQKSLYLNSLYEPARDLLETFKDRTQWNTLIRWLALSVPAIYRKLSWDLFPPYWIPIIITLSMGADIVNKPNDDVWLKYILLVIMLVGGAVFIAIFSKHSAVHSFMFYRQFSPLLIFSMAVFWDVAFRSMARLTDILSHNLASITATVMVVLAFVVVGALLVKTNAGVLNKELEFIKISGPQFDRSPITRNYLSSITWRVRDRYRQQTWRMGQRLFDGLPSLRHKTNLRSFPLRLKANETYRIDIFLRKPVRLSTVSLLVNRSGSQMIQESCDVWKPVSGSKEAVISPVRDRQMAYAWVKFSMDALPTEHIRIGCRVPRDAFLFEIQ